MDEKTEQLREVFRSVTDAEAVTEPQDADRGTLATDEGAADAAIADVVARMREALGFQTDLETAAYVAIVRRFFAGEDDAAIAADVGTDPAGVFRARLDLHLLRDDDAPVDADRLRREFEGVEAERVANELGVPVGAVERSRAVLAAQSAASGVSGRYRAAFVDALPDAAIAATITESVRDDGLGEATEDIGSLDSDADVDF